MDQVNHADSEWVQQDMQETAPQIVQDARMDSVEWSLKGKHVYLIGIGGCGMNGLARMMSARGAVCSGSDQQSTQITDGLCEDGIPVSYDQELGQLPSPCDLVVLSAAIKPDHPELVEANKQGVPVMVYAEVLGKLMDGRTGVSVAGTHGKSTTTAMLAHILIGNGLDPSVVVGATCPQIGGGCRSGSAIIPGTDQRGLLLAEACEYNRSFHHHHPTVAAILNVEEDHLDIYGSLESIIEAYNTFARLLPDESDGGYLLINHDEAHRQAVTKQTSCRVETIGFSSEADWALTHDHLTNEIAVCRKPDTDPLACWKSPLPGEHNAFNSAAAAVLAHHVGCEWDGIRQAIKSFSGIDRRMQCLGCRQISGGEVLVYDDYGHHPTEIKATLEALRNEEQPERLICVFQPHQYSRTRFLLEQFACSFSSADIVIVPHIYFVRDSELEKEKVCAADLVERLLQRGVQAIHLDAFDAIVERLETLCEPGDLLVTMGAGPVWEVGHRFMRSQ